MGLIEKLTAVADAIRSKTGGTEELTLDQMPTEISGIITGGGAQVLTYTAASSMAANYLVIEIEHGLGKIPTAILAINHDFLDAWGTDTSHHTWIWAGGRNFNFRTSNTAAAQLLYAPRGETLGIADSTSAICYADAEKIYLQIEPWRGLCAGETISVYVWE